MARRSGDARCTWCTRWSHAAMIGGGEATVDPAFQNADPRILAAAQEAWQRLQER